MFPESTSPTTQRLAATRQAAGHEAAPSQERAVPAREEEQVLREEHRSDTDIYH